MSPIGGDGMGDPPGARAQRRLAAILAADVVGFSGLMGRDEEGTLARVKRLRREIIEPKVRSHQGRVFKTTGDGFLAEFSSPVEAVRCALEVQQILANETAQEPSQALQLRIGINLGDVIVEEDGDVYGDGVNVAARLEQLAEPGSIWISGAVYDHVERRVDASLESRGEQRVKNITRPVRAYRIVLDAGGRPATPASPVADRSAVAVLPFENMSHDPEQSYFSDGISEDVITELSRFRELMVIARNSSFSLRGRSVDVREIGRLLGAGYVVEGSVRRAGNRVRVTAQLVDAVTGAHLWAERYDRALEDVFAIQEEIAQDIVATVAQRIIQDSEVAARRRQPDDIRAYDLFLQGNRLTDTFTPEAQARAMALFEQALQIDPGFARAHTGLAWIFLNRAVDGGVGVPWDKDENRLAALHHAEQAFALDANDARVHSTLGYMCLMQRDFDRAERHMDLARAMNPNDPMIQMLWAWLQSCIGKPERGLPAAEIGFRLNPCHPGWYNYFLAHILFQLRREQEAADLLERLTYAPARHPRFMAWRAAACGHLGRIPEAERCAAIFLDGVRSFWRGDPGAGPREYVDWLVKVAYLRRNEDEERLREGLRRAGLPA
jgi:adenylate cyclase